MFDFVFEIWINFVTEQLTEQNCLPQVLRGSCALKCMFLVGDSWALWGQNAFFKKKIGCTSRLQTIWSCCRSGLSIPRGISKIWNTVGPITRSACRPTGSGFGSGMVCICGNECRQPMRIKAHMRKPLDVLFRSQGAMDGWKSSWVNSVTMGKMARTMKSLLVCWKWKEGTGSMVSSSRECRSGLKTDGKNQ